MCVYMCDTGDDLQIKSTKIFKKVESGDLHQSPSNQNHDLYVNVTHTHKSSFDMSYTHTTPTT